jgi:hypothetical protein
MTITPTPRWSLGRGNAVVPSRWQATCECDRAMPRAPSCSSRGRRAFSVTGSSRARSSVHLTSPRGQDDGLRATQVNGCTRPAGVRCSSERVSIRSKCGAKTSASSVAP